jgi:DNA-directed RNA polymerase specialized sigma24 family protein
VVAKRGRGADGVRSGQIKAAVGWLARKRSVPRDVAEEAVQEALLQLVQLSSGRLPRDLDGWVRRIAERRLIDLERHRATQVPGSDGSDAHDLAILNPDLDALLAFRVGLQTLAPDRRELVVLRFLGVEWDEIESRTGVRKEAARKRFELALVELRRGMGGA